MVMANHDFRNLKDFDFDGFLTSLSIYDPNEPPDGNSTEQKLLVDFLHCFHNWKARNDVSSEQVFDMMQDLLREKPIRVKFTKMMYGVTFARIFKTEKGWESSTSFGRDELMLVSKVADLAHTWIYQQNERSEPEPEERTTTRSRSDNRRARAASR
jgi:hypothetical protein